MTNKKKNNDKFAIENVYVADFETTTSKNFTDFSKVYLAGFQKLGKFDDDIKITFQIGDFIRSLCDLKNDVITVYFHNGGTFDHQFILNYVIKTLKYSQCLTRKMNGKQFFLFEDEKKIYEISFFYRGKLLTFRDSILLIGGSIKSWGEIFKYEKLKIDYDNSYRPNHDYDQKVIDYFKRDITILNKALYGFYQHYQDLKPISIAGQMFKKFDYILKDWNLQLNITDFYNYQRYYFGGLVTYKTQFQNQWVKGDIHVYDINSSYPSVQQGYVPYSQPLKKKPLKGSSYCTFYKMWIESADIKNDNWAPIFRKCEGLEKDNSTDYIKHAKKFYLFIIDCEWEWYLKFYNIKFKILEKSYFLLTPLFKTHINKLYQYRLLLKKDKNKPAEMYVKTGLNSCYGRFAMKPNLKKTIYLNKQEQMKLLPKFIKKYDITKRNDNSRIGDKDCFLFKPQYKEIEHKFCSYIPLACYITAKARCKLLEAIWNNKDNFLYCDTDSVFLNGKAKGLNEHPIELGAWKCEAIGDSICYLQSKQYRILKNNKIIKQAHAGVRAQAIEKIDNKDYKIPIKIENGKLARIKVSGGVLLVEIPVELGFNNFIFINNKKMTNNESMSGNNNELPQTTKECSL